MKFADNYYAVAALIPKHSANQLIQTPIGTRIIALGRRKARQITLFIKITDDSLFDSAKHDLSIDVYPGFPVLKEDMDSATKQTVQLAAQTLGTAPKPPTPNELAEFTLPLYNRDEYEPKGKLLKW